MLDYFAYGSNMLTARLVARCPGARARGRGRVRGFTVAYAKVGRDGSGKATLLTAGGVVEGVVFAIPAAEVANLDEAEGLGRGYDRITLTAEIGERADRPAPATRPVFSYIATAPTPGLLPFVWYRDLILAGIAEHGLPPAVAAWHRAARAVEDPDPESQGRRAALAALAGGPPKPS